MKKIKIYPHKCNGSEFQATVYVDELTPAMLDRLRVTNETELEIYGEISLDFDDKSSCVIIENCHVISKKDKKIDIELEENEYEYDLLCEKLEEFDDGQWYIEYQIGRGDALHDFWKNN